MHLTTQLARQLTSQAERSAEVEFNRQHALAREAERAVEAIVASGARLKQSEQAAGSERCDAGDGGRPESDQTPNRSHSRPAPEELDDDLDDDDEQPSHWLT
ncbi:hypothetical protein SAMN05892883_1805 [Jatrophihabitans sp. GAS493]|nr:hypothetical protein SAMN05892883_1805 [Jatrophihabitans sp. GAS493]